MEPEPPGAAWSRLFLPWSRSRSRLRDLGHLELEPEPPKTVAAPQHCLFQREKKMYVKLFSIFFFKIDRLTLDPDPDPNWAKIQDPDPNSMDSHH